MRSSLGLEKQNRRFGLQEVTRQCWEGELVLGAGSGLSGDSG